MANKGNIPWNKGKKLPQFSGKNHPRYGKHHSETTKKKIGLIHKGKKLPLKIAQKLHQACSEKCSGKKHWNWKGGRIIDDRGAIRIYSPNHPFCDNHGYVYEHRLVMEKYLGRYLTSKEVVHHKGIKFPINSIENKSDNRLKNLQLLPSKSAHTALHNKLRKSQICK